MSHVEDLPSTMARASGREPQEQPHFFVPAFVADHRSPVVQEAIVVARIIFANRYRLGHDLRDARGKRIMPSVAEFLVRVGGESEYESRRADALGAQLRMWLVAIAAMDFASGELREPRTGGTGLLSVVRHAELAELPIDPARQDRTRCRRPQPGDKAERAARRMRAGGMLTKAKQHRAAKPDGGWEIWGVGIRAVTLDLIKRIGGRFWETLRRARGEMPPPPPPRGRSDDAPRARTRPGAAQPVRGPPPPPSPPPPPPSEEEVRALLAEIAETRRAKHWRR